LEALDIRQKNPGRSHPSYAKNLNNLILLYEKMGEKTKADQLRREIPQKTV